MNSDVAALDHSRALNLDTVDVSKPEAVRRVSEYAQAFIKRIADQPLRKEHVLFLEQLKTLNLRSFGALNPDYEQLTLAVLDKLKATSVPKEAMNLLERFALRSVISSIPSMFAPRQIETAARILAKVQEVALTLDSPGCHLNPDIEHKIGQALSFLRADVSLIKDFFRLPVTGITTDPRDFDVIIEPLTTLKELFNEAFQGKIEASLSVLVAAKPTPLPPKPALAPRTHSIKDRIAFFSRVGGSPPTPASPRPSVSPVPMGSPVLVVDISSLPKTDEAIFERLKALRPGGDTHIEKREYQLQLNTLIDIVKTRQVEPQMAKLLFNLELLRNPVALTKQKKTESVVLKEAGIDPSIYLAKKAEILPHFMRQVLAQWQTKKNLTEVLEATPKKSALSRLASQITLKALGKEELDGEFLFTANVLHALETEGKRRVEALLAGMDPAKAAMIKKMPYYSPKTLCADSLEETLALFLRNQKSYPHGVDIAKSAEDYIADIYSGHTLGSLEWMRGHAANLVAVSDQLDYHTNLGNGVCMANSMCRAKALLERRDLPSAELQLGSSERSRVIQTRYSFEYHSKLAGRKGISFAEENEIKAKLAAKEGMLLSPTALIGKSSDKRAMNRLAAFMQADPVSPVASLGIQGKQGAHAITLQLDAEAGKFRFADDNYGTFEFTSEDECLTALSSFLQVNYSKMPILSAEKHLLES